jgi:hypothetical protein
VVNHSTNCTFNHAYLESLWVTPEGRITTQAPDDAVEATLPDKEKTISLSYTRRLHRPTLVSHTGEVIIFVHDLPSSASENLREKTAKSLKETMPDHVDDTGEAAEKEKKENKKEDKETEEDAYSEFKSF